MKTILSLLLLASTWASAQSAPEPTFSFGTAAVALWRPGRAVLALDSKVGHAGAGPATRQCKIQQAGRFFIAISGLYSDTDTGYDGWQLSQRAAAQATRVDEAVDLIQRAIAPRIAAAVALFRKTDPVQFAKEFPGGAYLAIAVAGVEVGTARHLLQLEDFRRALGSRKVIALMESREE